MGRITPSFRQRYIGTIKMLKKKISPIIKQRRNGKILSNIIMEYWERDYAAMSNAESVSTLDILNLVACIATKREVERLKEKLKKLEEEIELHIEKKKQNENILPQD
jgi:benzoyl-CoA reductase/2-hydroxyglutaryl-CoA dehydratase subunit BcrC/BadD/HgdB